MERELTVGIISAGDKRYGGRIADPGEIVRDAIENKGYQIKSYTVLPDNLDMIRKELSRLCDNGLDLVVTTGGTGYSPRDCVPEATKEVAQRFLPTITEALRFFNRNIIKSGVISRGISAIRNNTLIINLPDTPRDASENIDYLIGTAVNEISMYRNSAV